LKNVSCSARLETANPGSNGKHDNHKTAEDDILYLASIERRLCAGILGTEIVQIINAFHVKIVAI
jgi:hypothetical protein